MDYIFYEGVLIPNDQCFEGMGLSPDYGQKGKVPKGHFKVSLDSNFISALDHGDVREDFKGVSEEALSKFLWGLELAQSKTNADLLEVKIKNAGYKSIKGEFIPYFKPYHLKRESEVLQERFDTSETRNISSVSIYPLNSKRFIRSQRDEGFFN
ncbi:MAG: hypothetical protein ACQER9_00685 [Nanobdellota archaeon]